MGTALNAKIQLEQGQTLTAYTAMTDSGDHQVYTAGSVWSGKSGYTPSIRPNGITSGRNLLSVHATNNLVTVAGFKAYVKGTEYTVAASSVTVTRTVTAAKACVYSITLASDGATLASVKGDVSADTTYSETRAAAGGPPLIPADSVELGQIRSVGATAAVFTASEIFQVVGTHTERADYPAYNQNNIGDGVNASESAKENSYIEFYATNPLTHTGPATRKTYIQYYTPVFVDLGRTVDFVPAEESASVSSQQLYQNKTVASTSKSLGAGSFRTLLADGVNDTIIANRGETLTVKFFPDENKSAYALTQGGVFLQLSYPADNQIEATATIASEQKTSFFSS